MRSAPLVDEDLTARARIRGAALELFAERGVAGTTIRAVAGAAGVSPGLVIHHFGSKTGLRAAVDQAVLDELALAFEEMPVEGSGAELLTRRTEQGAAVLRAQPALFDYLVRAFLEGTEAGAALFGRLVARARRDLDKLERAGAVRSGSDELWRALQHILLVVGPIALRPLVERELGGALSSPDQLERWMDANVDLLQNGLYT